MIHYTGALFLHCLKGYIPLSANPFYNRNLAFTTVKRITYYKIHILFFRIFSILIEIFITFQISAFIHFLLNLYKQKEDIKLYVFLYPLQSINTIIFTVSKSYSKLLPSMGYFSGSSIDWILQYHFYRQPPKEGSATFFRPPIYHFLLGL